MRSRADRLSRWLWTGLFLSGLAVPAMARDRTPPPPPTGPAADYPMVLGAPFTIDGVTYTPVDSLNYDQVGYAEIDPALGEGISVAHRTLPLPSYAEITSLRTGRTILVRVERRGPMSGSAIVALSAGAAAQLGTGDPRTPIRIRRVNPAEPERALLRSGQPAAARMDTPMSLVGVLMRKLDPAAVAPPAPVAVQPSMVTPPGPLPAPSSVKRPAVMPPTLRPVPAQPKSTPQSMAPSTPPPPPQATAKPVPQPAASSERSSAAAPVRPAPHTAAPKPTAPTPTAPTRAVPSAGARPAANGGAVVVQVGAYSSRAAAAAVAAKVGGAVSPAGRLFRVRIGAFASPTEAAGALAKARAAGYSEARIQRAD